MARRFGRDEHGSMVEKFAVAAGVAGLLALFFGTNIERLASAGQLPAIAFLSPDQYVATRSKDSVVDAIDYTATGSIRGRIVLDPCTGMQKSE